MKDCELLNSECAATRCKNFSRPRFRDSTKSSPKRPTVCFSGRGGTITPGNSRDSSWNNQEKSEYLLTTEWLPDSNPVLNVLEWTL